MSTLASPFYQIWINGVELDSLRYSLITSVTFEDNANGSDLLSINIEDPEFVFINDSIFIEENKVKFVGGYDGNSRVMFEGYISVVNMDFPESGSPTLTINCMDNTHLMNRVKKKRTWENTTRAKVARQIFQEYGFACEIEDSNDVQESIAQSDQTDIEFLKNIAEEEIDNFLVYVEGTKGFYVRKKILSSAQDVLDYRDGRQNLISFSPSINKETKQIEARSAEVNLLNKRVDKAQANDHTPHNVQGESVESTDRTNGIGSWYNNITGWKNTY